MRAPLSDSDIAQLVAASMPPEATRRAFAVKVQHQDGTAHMHTREGGHAIDHAQDAMDAAGIPGRVVVRRQATGGAR